MSTIKVEEIQHPSNSNNAVSIASDSSVSLKHSGSAKLATTSTGVSVTGTCAATSFTGDGSALSPAPTDTTKMPLAGGTFTGSVVFEDAINENIFAITDASSVALDPDNGMVQTWTLGANRTATDSLTTGQSMLLIVTASSSNYTLTWPTMKWNGGSAPTLGGANATAIELFKVGSQLYGATVGDLS
tara:strand:- start:1417 stop:1977 length:561 start_codon:yes stop_codon:yes gene_type:complete